MTIRGYAVTDVIDGCMQDVGDLNQFTYQRLQSSDDEWYCRRCKTPPKQNPMIKRNLHYLKVGSLNCRGLKGEGGKA